MSRTHQITRAVNDGSATIQKTESVTAGAALEIDEAIPDSSTNLAVAFAFVKAKLQSFYIVSDKNADVYTNDVSGGSPQDHIVLVANQPKMWTAADAAFIPNPFGGNVTSLYVTTGSVGTAQLQIRAIVDPT